MQDVIKMTFTALHDVIKAQGSAIKSLEREVKNRVSAADLERALIHKANIVDINSSLQDVSTGSAYLFHPGLPMNPYALHIGDQIPASLSRAWCVSSPGRKGKRVGFGLQGRSL